MCKNICRTKRIEYNSHAGLRGDPIYEENPMIDLRTIEAELSHARAARIDAEAASTDVEDMIRRVQHFEPGRGRLCFFIDGLGAAPPGSVN
jgi:hypothetical protein